MNNKKVLACQIDEELRAKMEEQRKNKKLSVKDYIIGLIEQDLKTHSFETIANEDLNKVQGTTKNEEAKEQIVKEEIQEQPIKEENGKGKAQIDKETKKDEEKQQVAEKKDSKEKQVEKGKKEEVKQQPNITNKKLEVNKSKTKKIQKEEEEEFE